MSAENSIYLDHAAATPLDERVFVVMEPYLREKFYNPAAAYASARAVRAEYEDARWRLAMSIGGSREEIVLTAGATESINIVFHGVLALGNTSDTKGHVVIGATEHAAVRGAAEQYACDIAVTDQRGIITPEAVKAVVTPETRLVSVTIADSELGTVQKLRDIAAVIDVARSERATRGDMTPIYLHSDASQGAGALDINVARLGVDLLTLNAGKIYGPKQVGLLWVRAGIVLEPLIRGGGQEKGVRSGTENVAGAIGFATALELAQAQRHEENERLTTLRTMLMSGLQKGLADMIVNGHPKRHLPGHLNISIPGVDAERVVFALDQRGIQLATGAACAANKGTRSKVLEAIGLDDRTADGSLRLSLGHLNDEAQIAVAIPIIIETINQERGK